MWTSSGVRATRLSARTTGGPPLRAIDPERQGAGSAPRDAPAEHAAMQAAVAAARPEGGYKLPTMGSRATRIHAPSSTTFDIVNS